MTRQTGRLRTLEQARAFIEGSEAADFTGEESIRALVRFDHDQLGKPDEGLARGCLAKATKRSRGQLARLIRQHHETGRIEDRRSTRADIRLLASVRGPGVPGVRRRRVELQVPLGYGSLSSCLASL